MLTCPQAGWTTNYPHTFLETWSWYSSKLTLSVILGKCQILCFSTLPHDWKGLEKNWDEKVEGLIVVPYWPTELWFSWFTSMRCDSLVIQQRNKTNTDISLEIGVLTAENLPPDSFCLRKNSKTSNFSESTEVLLHTSWRTSTHKQYSTYIKKWIKYCSSRNISSTLSNINHILDFLSHLLANN